MQDILAALLSFFLIEPLQASLAETLSAARVPQAVIAEVSGCARQAAPALVARATGDPGWAVTTTLQLWTGLSRPEDALVSAVPGCGPAVDSARPFLAARTS